MSSKVEHRIVTMKFDNKSFQRDAQATMGMLDKLKEKLSFKSVASGAGKVFAGLGKGLFSIIGKLNPIKNPFSKAQQGAADLQRGVNNFTMAPMVGATTSVSKSFIAMSTVAITALSNITNKALNSATSLAKGLTVDPITEGLKEYETQLNSIQTILANTESKGTTLEDVNAGLNELNKYADQTIYNFTAMTDSIGKFTVAGVGLDDSVAAIKGFSNAAALAGANSQETAGAMKQLAQGMSSGTIRLQDWLSIETAGIASEGFRNSLIDTAKVHGVNVDKMIKEQGSFRLTLQEGWLTQDIMGDTLKKFTGDLSDADLKRKGYTAAQIKDIQKLAKSSLDAATKVKTATQLIDVLKEAVGSGWAQTWQIIIGDFEEAKALWTGVSEVLTGMIGKSAEMRNKVLGDWKKLGGRKALLEGLKNIFEALMAVLKPLGEAFREIFPRKTGKELAELSKSFQTFTEGLKVSDSTAQKIKRTFAGVFAVFSIAGQIISGIVGVIFRLVGSLTGASGGLLKFTGGIGDFLVALDNSLKKSGAFEGFFKAIGDVLMVPVKAIRVLADMLGSLFNGYDSAEAEEISSSIKSVSDSINPLTFMEGKVNGVIDSVLKGLSEFGNKIGEVLASAFSAENFDRTLEVIETILIGGILFYLRKFVKEGVSISHDVGTIGDNVSEMLTALTGTLAAMQTSIQAGAIMKIAVAVLLLTASLLILSSMNETDLAKGLAAAAVGIGILAGALIGLMVAASKITVAVFGISSLAISMVALATALLILSHALERFAELKFGKALRGLVTMQLVITIMQKALLKLAAGAPGMLAGAASLLVVSGAMKVMASALADFAELSLEELAKGLGSVAASLTILSRAMLTMPPTMGAQAASLVVLGVALNVIASAVKQFGKLKVSEIAKGLLSVAAALGIIALAMMFMPPTMGAQAAALIAVGVALNGIAAALKIMGGQSWNEVAKSLVTLTVALALLAAGLLIMNGTLGGSAALVVAAAGLTVLGPALAFMGNLDWSTILKGLVALALILTVLGLAGYLLAPVVPVIIGLGAAMLLLGAGIALAGAGILAITTSFTMLAASGLGAAVSIGVMIATVTKKLPAFFKALGEGVLAFITAISKAGPRLTKAFGRIITIMLNAIIRNAPKMAEAFLAMLDAALKVLSEMTPKIVNAGLRLMLKFLEAVDRNVPKIVDTALSIVTKFLDTIGKRIPKVIQAGVDLILRFINGLTKAIDNNAEELGRAGAKLGIAIIKGMAKGIWGGIDEVKSAAKSVAKSALGAAMDFLGVKSPSREFIKLGRYVDEGFAIGISTYSGEVDKSVRNVAGNTLASMREAISNVGDTLSGEMNLQPVIKPVLDLSTARKDAQGLSSMFDKQSMTQGSIYQAARQISEFDSYSKNTDSKSDDESKEVSFVQNNYSPKALSPVEIYRNTKNQISLAREAIDKL